MNNEVKEPAYLSLSDWQGMTKKEIATQAQTLVDVILETGGADKAAERLSNMESFIKEVRANENFKEEVISEIKKHPGSKLSTPSGAKLELMEASVKYHYENTGDPVIIELQAKAKAAAEALKEREKFLQALPKEGFEVVDKETGEAYTIYAPYKTSSTTYKCTLK